MCQTVVGLVALFALAAGEVPVKSTMAPIYTVAEAAKQIEALLDDMSKIPADDPVATNSARSSLASMLDAMRQKSVMLFGERRSQFEAINVQLELACRNWSQAKTNEARRESFAVVRKSWAALKQQFPSEALQVLPRLWSCPMHGEVLESSAGTCSICGMSLEPVYVTQPQLISDPIVQAEIIAPDPLQVGTKAELRIHLTFNDGKAPVTLADLEETHTRRVHLLITEPTETDYHHEHPEPLGDGEYGFSFTPARPGIYRVWADLKPLKTHVQQFSIADIPASTKAGRLQPDESENRNAEVGGYKFELSLAKPIVQAKDTIAGTVRVIDPSGRPCDKLEVVMGAFGHLVGFSDDFSTVLHMHPVGQLPARADSLGGPDLPFYFRSNKAGLIRLFAQVKIGGKDFFPRFVIKVQPLQHLPGS
jgi:Heavy metal binding domain